MARGRQTGEHADQHGERGDESVQLQIRTSVEEHWQVQPLSASSGAATAGVYRVSGTVTDDGTHLEWALVLKIIRPAAAAWNPTAREIDHPIYWKREALAYASGLLDDLPGDIAAPRCFALEERADESCWLWLEASSSR